MEHIWQTASGTPEVSAEWGETLIALGRIDEGRDWLERAIRMKHDLPFAHLALADIYRNVDENDDEADDALIEAIHIDPDTVYAILYDDIIDALTDAEAFEAFNALFKRAAEEKPIAPIFHNWGQVLALNPDYGRESIRAFEAAIELDPDYGPAYVGLGSLLVQLERLQRAIPILEQATYRMYPFLTATDWHKTATVYQRSHAHLALAVAYAQAHQYENSAIAACTVLELAPKELEEDAPELLTAYVEAANTWMKKGENLRAYKFLNQIIPLAAYWGKVQIFTLLGIAQNKIPAEHRREQQWDDAEDWLKASLVDLQQNSDEDH
jgi:tetratricopeptide (TPR) repeat protein